jgi:hypothetical protein
MRLNALLILLAGAVISRLAQPIADRITQTVRQIRAAATLDHQTIRGTACRNDHGGGSRILLHIACAPSRSWRKLPRLNGERQPWVKEIVGEDLELEFFTPNELLRFISVSPDSGGASFRARPNGLIELSMPLEHEIIHGEPALSVTEIGRAIQRFSAAVGQGAYRSIFGGKKVRKVDWFIGISQGLHIPNKGFVPWKELRFPGRLPSPRPREMHPPVFGPGLAEARLSGRPIRTDSMSVCKAALVDLFERSGYPSFGDALEDSLATIRNERSEFTQRRGTREAPAA